MNIRQEGMANICQLDGNDTRSSLITSDKESETESENEELGNSSEEEEDEVSSSSSDNAEEISCVEAEGNSDSDNEPEPANNIPIVIGFRPPPIIQDTRAPVRTTIQRNNKLVDALSAPKLSLINVRSAWSKWNSIADSIETRSTNLCFLTEVWERLENKKHKDAIESIFELKGIKYISTPRPGVRRGGVQLWPVANKILC